MPTDSQLEKSLRNAVRAHYSDPGDEPPTVNSIRAESELDLGLSGGFYKSEEWKTRSKEIIQDQFHKSDEQKEQEGNEKAKKPLKRPSPSPVRNSRPRKKSKVEQIQSEEVEESTALSEPPESEEEEEEEAPKVVKKQRKTDKKPAKSSKAPPPKKKTAKPTKKASSDSELSDAPAEVPEESEETKPATKGHDIDDGTSSELSSVIDDPPPARKNSKAKDSGSKPTKATKSSTKTKPSAIADPNAEEIKRLQGWLVKCGVRKVWGKELKPFESSKAKIGHLKSMLADVGMSGRYSNEKAAQIKEARELAADIEAVQEGNERWGKNSDEEADDGDGGRPARRLVRGAQNYDFLSSDGEETD